MVPTNPGFLTRPVSQTKWVWICCPKTGEEVVSYLEDPFDMFGSPAAWWECPACGSWHISMIDELKDLREQMARPQMISPRHHGLIFKTHTPHNPLREKLNG